MNSLPEIELTLDLLKKLQKIQLEMLIEIDRICDINNIKYSLDGGTLLGAARNGKIILPPVKTDAPKSSILIPPYLEASRPSTS